MLQSIQQQIDLVSSAAIRPKLGQILRGIEKESLRITAAGQLAQSPHPSCLGAALTNPHVTTDYSEALLEFITPTHRSVDELLNCLDEVHRFTYQCLPQELLWTASMPCVLRGCENIPVAQYGDSNIGRMKTIYRIGLGHRYGRAMQTIAGVHYNFSLSDDFWEAYRNGLGNTNSLQVFKNTQYLGLIRNFRRYAWLLIYLFGASPALCKSFLGEQSHNLENFDPNTLFRPDATSLRMGKLGYQSSAQEDIIISYNSLDSYVSSLLKLLQREHDGYRELGIKGPNGEWRQLSTSLLQIENEFYSSIRPKQPVVSGEAPLRALETRGIEYIEVRALDVNPYLPLGIDSEQIRFLDLFLLYCLLQPSPALEPDEYLQSQRNLASMVDNGRSPELQLEQGADKRSAMDWAQSMMQDLAAIAELLEDEAPTYQAALRAQQRKIDDNRQTPSGRILEDMRDQDLTWFHFALQKSEAHAAYFQQRPLNEASQQRFSEAASASLAQQERMESASTEPFEQFLRDYYRQYQLLPE